MEVQYIGYSDGATFKGNPGLMGLGALIMTSENELVDAYSKLDNWGTSNEAEWLALIMLLEEAKQLGIRSMEIRADSKMIINLIKGKWRQKAPHLIKYRDRAKNLTRSFTNLQFVWIPRTQNREADKLSKQPFLALC